MEVGFHDRFQWKASVNAINGGGFFTRLHK